MVNFAKTSFEENATENETNVSFTIHLFDTVLLGTLGACALGFVGEEIPCKSARSKKSRHKRQKPLRLIPGCPGSHNVPIQETINSRVLKRWVPHPPVGGPVVMPMSRGQEKAWESNWSQTLQQSQTPPKTHPSRIINGQRDRSAYRWWC